MTTTTKPPRAASSGSAKREKGKTHASWPKSGSSQSITVSKTKK